MTVELDIERLVLEGLDGVNGRQIGAAVKAELAGLLAARGVPQRLTGGFSARQFDGGSFTAQPGVSGSAMGRAIARSVYRGLGR